MPYTFTRTGAQIEEIHNTVDDPSSNQSFTESIANEVIAKYTDIVYKASGGKSAVENMTSGFPISSNVGDICKTGATSWVMETKSNPVVIGDFKPLTYIHAVDFGVIADGVNDDTSGVNYATSVLNSIGSGTLILPSGVISYIGVWRPRTAGNSYHIKGSGSGDGGTVFKFSYVSGESVSIIFDTAFFGMRIQGINFKGQGKLVTNPDGSDQVGMSDRFLTSDSYGFLMQDIQFSDWSGTGAEIINTFQQKWERCYARSIKNYGYIIDGDQAPYWDNSGGAWSADIDGFGLWFKGGRPTILNLNHGPMNGHVKLGDNSVPLYCHATIRNANLEWINEGGVGVQVDEFSTLVECSDLLAYGPFEDGATTPNTKNCRAVIEFVRATEVNDVSGVRLAYVGSNDGFGGFDNIISILNHYSPTNPIVKLGKSRDTETTFRAGPIRWAEGPDSSREVAAAVVVDEFLDNGIAANGVQNSGVLGVAPVFWVRSTDGGTINFNLFAGGELPTNSNYIINPDDGFVFVNLPPAANWLNKMLTITNMTSINGFTVNTFGSQEIDGNDNLSYSDQYASVTLLAVDADNWVQIYKK